MDLGAGTGVRAGYGTLGRLGVLVTALWGAGPADAQEVATRRDRPPTTQDSADVVASERYRAGGFHRFFLGGRYRQVWAARIRVPVLDLRRFAGGLTPKDRGGGFQTRSLQLTSADGREFRFRSVDKDPAQSLPERYRRPAIERLVRDQTSALHPGGALAAAALAEAAGVPAPTPRLVLMPDDPVLGTFREEFAGMLGTIEVHPEGERDGRPGFAGFHEVLGTDELVPRLNRGPDDRLDARAYLAARLLDMFVNDWDRHQGNWRWGTRDRRSPYRWVAIPKDRDQVFAWYGGALLGVVRLRDPRLIPFTHDYKVKGLTSNGAELDRRFLAALERPVWDSIAHALQARLTDRAIAAALERMPAPYQELTGAEIAAALRSRRAKLPDAAAAFYAGLARVVDVHGTDAPELVRVNHQPDGAVEITLARRDTGGPPHFRRRFVPAETREVRVYLHGGDDSVAVGNGERPRIAVRLIAGKGEDPLPTGAGVQAYPLPGDSSWYPADSLVEPVIDRRPWAVGGTGEHEPPPVDIGGSFAPSFGVRYASELGLVLRGGGAMVRYGFRTQPHSLRLGLGLTHAFGIGSSRAEVHADLQRESSRMFLGLAASASGLDRPWFFGLGNQSVSAAPADAYRTSHRQYRVAAELGVRGEGWLVVAGPSLRYARSDAPELAVPAFGRGAGDYRFVELSARAELDRRDRTTPARPGFTLSAGAAVAPGVWDAEGTFGTVRATATAFLAPAVPLSPVFAFRLGLARAWGPVPWFDTPAIGGESTLRGYDVMRFAGDGAAFGGAEVRARLFGFTIGVPGDLGLVALGDAGRVWLGGERSDRWHSAWGGGLWVSMVDPAATLSATLADGERTMLYIRGGFAF
jgi:hypothetical protein